MRSSMTYQCICYCRWCFSCGMWCQQQRPEQIPKMSNADILVRKLKKNWIQKYGKNAISGYQNTIIRRSNIHRCSTARPKEIMYISKKHPLIIKKNSNHFRYCVTTSKNSLSIGSMWIYRKVHIIKMWLDTEQHLPKPLWQPKPSSRRMQLWLSTVRKNNCT